MDEAKRRISDVAELMEEFGLAEAHWSGDGVTVAFKRKRTVVSMAAPATVDAGADFEVESEVPADELVAVPEISGTPITSPMNGIFYRASSPSAAPFVTEGDTITAGQVIGLIEAMKVFNEITATVSGKVVKINVETGVVVQPGEVLMLIG